MAQFALPARSKPMEGRHYPAAGNPDKVKTFHIYRWDPEELGEDGQPKNPRIDSFEIDLGKMRADGAGCAPLISKTIWIAPLRYAALAAKGFVVPAP